MDDDIRSLFILLFSLFSVYTWAVYIWGKASAYREVQGAWSRTTDKSGVTYQTSKS